ncbi:MAG TPA: hypothetical protein VGL81_18945 [Polyangiaceae bacterium]|jgi:hypothetical protein
MIDIPPMPSAAPTAPAAPAAPSSTPDDRSTSFVAVQGNAKEQYSGGALLVTAYAALWVVLFAWVAIVWRKQGALNSRLVDLERVLDKAAADAEAEKKTEKRNEPKNETKT